MKRLETYIYLIDLSIVPFQYRYDTSYDFISDFQ